jgi:hypothetical protein
MAVNPYVTINGKQYPVAQTRYEPIWEKIQAVHVTVGGAHLSQHFNFIEKKWGFDLVVPYTGDATWGDVDDLHTAYALEYASFTDHYGTTHDAFFEGPMVDIPYSPLIDQSGKAIVPVNLRKKQ